MTRKHFEAVAEEVQRLPGISDTKRALLATRLAVRFQSFNPKFDHARFIDACTAGDDA